MCRWFRIIINTWDIVIVIILVKVLFILRISCTPFNEKKLNTFFQSQLCGDLMGSQKKVILYFAMYHYFLF